MRAAAARPPIGLVAAVALVAASMLLVELIATRLFSVLFFYHFSFFAISLVMTGLAAGGLAVSRWNLRDLDETEFLGRLGSLALAFAATVLVALAVVLIDTRAGEETSLGAVALRALAFLPALVVAGAFLASAFAREETWIGRLYAADLIAAAAACLGVIYLMRLLAGPATLLAPAALAALAALALPARRWAKTAALLLLAATAAAATAHLATDGRILRLPQGENLVFERWNEHSRISGYEVNRNAIRFVIDKTAATGLRRVGPEALRDPPRIHPGWGRPLRYSAYQLGRQLDTVAIIGVGAGQDVGPAVAHGASRIDGYELNRILIEVLERDYRDFYTLAQRPEVHLIHSEGRVGIAHAGVRYDLIQASLIDTWAATASGGFVLAENGLYTLEGWRRFLAALDDDGILTMTRWLLPGAPAETQRLVALAAAALEDAGVEQPGRHVLLAADPRALAWRDPYAPESGILRSTILVSRSPYDPAEVERFRELCASRGWQPLWLPGGRQADPVVAALLDPATRAATIAESPFDIAPPTDERPYFFLQIRPRDLPRLLGKEFGMVTEITFNGIRVMVILAALSLAFAAAVWAFASFTLPSRETAAGERRTYRWMTLYFLGIGVGYILVQLGLHQRLILILGHPTTALAVVLFSMLLGTGAGSAVSSRIADHRMTRAWLFILAVLLLLVLGHPLFGRIEELASAAARAAIAGGVAAVTGFALGFAFPLGVRLAAPTGQWAVQKLWAVNGAASIAGSALAGLIGISFGSFQVLAAGALCYLLVTASGSRALRSRVRSGGGSPAGTIT